MAKYKFVGVKRMMQIREAFPIFTDEWLTDEWRRRDSDRDKLYARQ